MKYIVLFIILLGFSPILYGQLKPSFLPEEIIVSDINNEYYGQSNLLNKSRARGLTFTYGFTNSSTYNTEPTTTGGNGNNELDKLSFIEFKLKIPILIKKRTKILVGYKYFAEFYKFQTIQSDYENTLRTLDQQSLRNTDYSVILSHTINKRKYLNFRYKFASNGNYDQVFNFEQKNAIHSFMGIYSVRKSESFEWGVGVVYSNSFRRNNIIPFILYNRSFNDKWGIESLFPYNFFLRYNANPKTVSLIGVEFNSQSYRLAIEEIGQTPLDYAFNHSEVLSSINIERNLTSWIWASFKLGYQFNFDNEFEAKSVNAIDFQASQASGWFVNIGLFVSPNF